jgi:hypothetical protein
VGSTQYRYARIGLLDLKYVQLALLIWIEDFYLVSFLVVKNAQVLAVLAQIFFF